MLYQLAAFVLYCLVSILHAALYVIPSAFNNIYKKIRIMIFVYIFRPLRSRFFPIERNKVESFLLSIDRHPKHIAFSLRIDKNFDFSDNFFTNLIQFLQFMISFRIEYTTIFLSSNFFSFYSFSYIKVINYGN